MDVTDRRVLTALTADPRISMTALGRQVGLSAPAVTERVRRLEQAGVIAGYTVTVDPARLGLPVSAFVRIRPGPGQLPNLTALAKRHDHVSECHRITGEDCLLLRVHAASIQALEAVLDEFLLYGQTTTSVVVATPVPARSLPLD